MKHYPNTTKAICTYNASAPRTPIMARLAQVAFVIIVLLLNAACQKGELTRTQASQLILAEVQTGRMNTLPKDWVNPNE